VERFPFGLLVYRNENAPGTAFVATAQQFTGDKHELLAGLVKGENHDIVFTEVPVTSKPETRQSGKSNSVTLTHYSPNKRAYDIEVTSGNILVFTENYYPGWHILIDGKPAQQVKVNHTFSGIFVSQGTHTITRYFMPRSLIMGAIISLIALLLVIAGFFLRRKPE
jgi:uncharacterized membrane protein YfhO